MMGMIFYSPRKQGYRHDLALSGGEPIGRL